MSIFLPSSSCVLLHFPHDDDFEGWCELILVPLELPTAKKERCHDADIPSENITYTTCAEEALIRDTLDVLILGLC